MIAMNDIDTETKRKEYNQWVMEKLNKMYREAYDKRWDVKGYGFGEFLEDIKGIMDEKAEQHQRAAIVKPVEIITKPIEAETISPAKEDKNLAANLHDYYKSLSPLAKLSIKLDHLREKLAPKLVEEKAPPLPVIEPLKTGFIQGLKEIKLSAAVILGAATLGFTALASSNWAGAGAVIVVVVFLSPAMAKELKNEADELDTTNIVFRGPIALPGAIETQTNIPAEDLKASDVETELMFNELLLAKPAPREKPGLKNKIISTFGIKMDDDNRVDKNA